MITRFLFILSLVLACATPAPRPAPRFLLIDGPAAKRLVADGAVLVDVRAADFYQREHIAGAINIPFAEVESRAAVAIGPTTTAVIVYCRTGKNSARAAAILARMGYERVYDLGSYLNWGEGAPAPTPLPPALAPASDSCPAPAQ